MRLLDLPRLPQHALLAFLLGLSTLGCGESMTVIEVPDAGSGDAGTDGSPDAGGGGMGGQDPGNTCTGQCLPVEQFQWSEPLLLWLGPVGDPATVCPPQAPVSTLAGYRDIVATNNCPLCECEPPACELPAGLVASTLSTCPNDGPGATLTSFDAPQGWDGACASPTTIPSSLLSSIGIKPPTVTACTPKTATVPKAGNTPTWQTMGVVCKGAADGNCGEAGKRCVPSAPDTGGFRHCIWNVEDDVNVVCPTDYPNREIVYSNFVDTRDCAACSCDPPVGSNCVASVSAHQDASCQGLPTPLFASYPVSLASINACISGIMPGAELQGMIAQWVTNQPGTCTPSGGEPIGDVTPDDATVFCCQSSTM